MLLVKRVDKSRRTSKMISSLYCNLGGRGGAFFAAELAGPTYISDMIHILRRAHLARPGSMTCRGRHGGRGEWTSKYRRR